MTVDVSTIRAAREVVRTAARLTPVWPIPVLDGVAGGPVFVKCEQLQLTGSFKIRGALNFVHQLAAGEAERGLVAASAGNHAQGLAYAARAAGIPVKVVMPTTAPLAKVTATRELGADVVLHGSSLEAARSRALEIASQEGRVHVPPFDDDRIIAGQGTLGLELLEQLPDVAEVLVPAGGGGLLAGVAVAVKALRPDVRVIGVQTRSMDGIRQSLAAGKAVLTESIRTIADGVAVAGPSQRTFELINRYVDDVVCVGEEAIAHAVVLLLERAKLVTEGAGALGVAAIQSGAYRPTGRTAVVLSGGNIDINLLGAIVRHGLVEAGRYQRLAVEVADTPGELGLVTAAVGAAGASVLEVEHVRELPGLPIGTAVLELIVEVNGSAHFAEVLAELERRGASAQAGRAVHLSSADARRRREQD